MSRLQHNEHYFCNEACENTVGNDMAFGEKKKNQVISLIFMEDRQ